MASNLRIAPALNFFGLCDICHYKRNISFLCHFDSKYDADAR